MSELLRLIRLIRRRADADGQIGSGSVYGPLLRKDANTLLSPTCDRHRPPRLRPPPKTAKILWVRLHTVRKHSLEQLSANSLTSSEIHTVHLLSTVFAAFFKFVTFRPTKTGMLPPPRL